jgi:hydrogenase-4 component B
LGVLLALAQHDLKRLLAYCSVENIGVIALGLGVGLVGLAEQMPGVATLGFAGALLHVVNHALFKSLLFYGAGAVQHAAGILELDRLGGLLKKMPWTGGVFFIGAVAICGLPPLNGFVSEFCVFLGALQGLVRANGFAAGGLLTVILALGFIGGLAAACFTKAFGIVFLGEPRGKEAADAHECGRRMLWPMLLTAAACIVFGLTGLAAFRAALPAVGLPLAVASFDRVQTEAALLWAGLGASVLWVLILFIALLRKRLLAGRTASPTVTWDCGYVAPSPRMQYTASSFAQPLTDMFAFVLRTRKHVKTIETFFPEDSQMETSTPDVFREKIYLRAFEELRERLVRVRLVQHGRVHLYVLYVVLTLIVLLVWKMG